MKSYNMDEFKDIDTIARIVGFDVPEKDACAETLDQWRLEHAKNHPNEPFSMGD